METNRHNIDNFEKFLRQKTDEFRMYPSKRVWYSIYNDMHPGNRLPSVSMTVVLIGFLFLVGYLNTTDTARENNAVEKINQTPAVLAAVPNTSAVNNIRDYTMVSETRSFDIKVPVHTTDLIVPGKAETKEIKNSSHFNTQPKISARPGITQAMAGKTTITNKNRVAEKVVITEVGEIQADYAVVLPVENAITTLVTLSGEAAAKNTQETDYPAGEKVTAITQVNEEQPVTEKTPPAAAVARHPVEKAITAFITAGLKGSNGEKTKNTGSEPTDKVVAIAAASNKPQLTLNDKAWMDDFVLHNKPAAKKWAGKLGLQAYITPSVVYRQIRNNAADKQLAGTNNNFNNFNADDVVKHKPSFGLETGLSLQYDISKRIRIRVGAQLNYTRYNAFAYETNHPVASTLTMNSDDNIMTYEVFRTSNFTNIYGIYSTKLHNETYQFSLPAGLDYKLADISENVSWYAGATLQPTVLLYARSFVLSTDRRSYVEDPSLLNRFNMNAGFETYFSFKRSGYTLQLGPQYRTQLFSTNTKVYSLEERLQNFGVKLGITKQL